MPANRKEPLSTPKTLRELCFSAAQRYSKRDALNLKRGGEWINVSAAEFVRRVIDLAVGLAELGVKPGDRIALLSENRPEWSVADLAIVSLGAVNVPIYTTQAVEQVQYILEDSNAKFIFVSGRKVYKHARPGISKRSSAQAGKKQKRSLGISINSQVLLPQIPLRQSFTLPARQASRKV